MSNSPFFTPKTLGSVLAGAGSMGGGGGAVYLYQMPKTWKELLVKEGFVFLNTEEEYKGMFHDQKDTDSWKNETEVKDSKEGDVKAKAEGYCSKKLQEKLPNSSDSDYSTTKQKLISFCTTEGITTVKGRLIQSKQQKWIDEKGEDKWKAVFAVYRYNHDFIGWLKSDNTDNKNLSSTSDVSEYTKLQNACKKLLASSWKEIKDNKYFNYGSWWCVELGYTTIKEKILKDDSGWSELEQSSSEWANLKSTWENHEQVKKWAKPNGGNGGEELSEEGLKALCKNDEEGKGVKSKLSDNDSYQEKYLVIRSVCKKNSVTN